MIELRGNNRQSFLLVTSFLHHLIAFFSFVQMRYKMEACRETYSRFRGESRRNNNRVSTYTTITLNNTAIL